MAASEAQKKAFKKYSETEKGKEALRRGAEKYQSTEQGQAKRKEAQERFEASEERKAYLREWHRKRRLRLKNEKLEVEKAN